MTRGGRFLPALALTEINFLEVDTGEMRGFTILTAGRLQADAITNVERAGHVVRRAGPTPDTDKVIESMFNPPISKCSEAMGGTVVPEGNGCASGNYEGQWGTWNPGLAGPAPTSPSMSDSPYSVKPCPMYSAYGTQQPQAALLPLPAAALGVTPR